MNSKQGQTLKAIFDLPIRSDIKWTNIESLFKALGAEVYQGRGSRVRVALNGVKAVFHEPHPEKETDKGAVKAVREFLEKADIQPEDY
jgi:HicA toxin of bacterial toxin-antitoxin,